MKRAHFVPCLAAAALAWLGSAPRLNAQALVITPQVLSFTSQSGQIPTPQTLSIQTSTGTALQFTVAVFPEGARAWLSAAPLGTSTPTTVMVFVTPTGLQPGTYNGSIRITAAGATNSPFDVQVTLTVGAVSQLVASPAQLSFSYVTGGTQPAPQNLSVTTSSGVTLSFTASASTPTGANWLTVNPTGGATPATLSVSVNTVGLAAGNYSGTITLTPLAGGGGALQVPVALTVSGAPTLTASPASVSFYHQIGTPLPAQQILSLTSPGASVSYNLAYSSQGNWLVVSPISGFTPSDLAVGVSSAVLATLPQGTYTGSIQIAAPQASNSPLTVQVTLTVSTNPLISATPSSLTFDVQPGGALPPSKTVTLASSGTPVNFSLAVSPPVSWLTVSPTTGTTTQSFTVGIGPSGLALTPGPYSATIVVTAPGAGNSPLNVPVTLNVSSAPVMVASPNALYFNYQKEKSLPAGQTVSLTSTGTPINFTVAPASTGNWLSVSQPSGATPATLGVTVNPAGLAVASHQGTITLTPQVSGAVAQTLNVTLTVSNNPLMNVSPSTFSFAFAPGGTTTQVQNLGLTSTSDSLNFTASWSIASGPAGWLAVTPLGGATPANLNVFAISTGLAPGTYTGSINVSATGANSQTIPVTLTVSTGNNLAVSPASLSFEQPQGGPAPAAKTLQVSTSGASLSFSATATTVVGSWLSVNPVTGTTPGTLSVTANGAGLSQGTYGGNVTVVAAGASNSPQTIPVTLTIGAAQTIAVSPASLSFSFQQGGSPPATQKVAVSSTGGSLNFTASAAATGNWLSVSPASGSTAGEVTVSVNPAGVAPGTHTGTVSIASTAATNSPQTVNVTLTVAARVVGPVTAVANAASWAPGPVAPGEIVAIGGTNIGPATPAGLRLTPAGLVDTNLSDTRVLFDGIPAPLTYVSRNQINCVAPYGIAGRVTTRIQVEHQGVRSEAIELRVAEAAPGIFTIDASGSGQGAILNQNSSVNGAGNPAAKGSVAVIYATGEGQTNPPGRDGAVIGAALSLPLREVFVTIGGRPARVLYAGSAPGFVAGVLQVNAVVPEEVASGSLAVVLTIAGNSSPSTVTLAVR
ncbi:MAG: IPT/TIG domain-containing protein [Acidobacteriota bacterium]